MVVWITAMDNMKKITFCGWLALTTLFSLTSVQAEIVFDREKGVRVEGGFLSRFFHGFGSDGEQAQSLIKKAEGELAEDDYRGALSTYKKIAKRFPIEKVETGDGRKVYAAAEALYQSALVRERYSQWGKAFDALQEVVDKYPSYDFDKVIVAQSRIAAKVGSGARTKIFRVIPGFRNFGQAREFHQKIAENARGPEHAPAALMASADIAREDNKEIEAIDSLERLINLYSEDSLCEKAYFDLAVIHESMVKGPLYDQGATLKAVNFYEDYLILFETISQVPRETEEGFAKRREAWRVRLQEAEQGLGRMRDMLARSKLEIGKFYHRHGHKFAPRSSVEKPATQYYNEAITLAPDSESARSASELLKEFEKAESQP